MDLHGLCCDHFSSPTAIKRRSYMFHVEQYCRGVVGLRGHMICHYIVVFVHECRLIDQSSRMVRNCDSDNLQ